MFDIDVQINEYQGDEQYISVQLGRDNVIIQVPASMNHDPGAAIGITVPSKNAYLFHQESGEALESKSEDAIEESAMIGPKNDRL